MCVVNFIDIKMLMDTLYFQEGDAGEEFQESLLCFFPAYPA